MLHQKTKLVKGPDEIKFFGLLEQLRHADEDFFFFFDNVDSLIEADARLVSFIDELLEKCPLAKVIITSRVAIHSSP